MVFTLKIRPLTDNDLSRLNPFLPEEDEYEIFLQALCEDLAKTDEILKVTQDNSLLFLETNEVFSEVELKKKIKPVFTDALMEKLRFVSLVKS